MDCEPQPVMVETDPWNAGTCGQPTRIRCDDECANAWEREVCWQEHWDDRLAMVDYRMCPENAQYGIDGYRLELHHCELEATDE